jgi:hypothetical protein
MKFEFRKPKGAERSPNKVCLECRVEKDVYKDFYWSHGVGTGWPNGKCKECSAKRLIEYRSTRKAKYCEYAKNQRLRNPEKAKEIQRKSYLKDGPKRKAKYLASKAVSPHKMVVCRDCGIEKDSHDGFYSFTQPCKKCHAIIGKLARLKDPEGTRLRRKKYYQENKEAHKIKAAQWAKDNPIRVRERRLAYSRTEIGRKADLDKTRRRRAKHMDALLEGAAPITTKWFSELCASHGNRCYYCWNGEKKLTADHVVALINGGKHVRENILPSCALCNSRKNDITVSKWCPEINIPLYGLELASA